MFERYEPVMHSTRGKGRIIGTTPSFENPWVVELEAGGTCLAGNNELQSLGPSPEPEKPKTCPEAIKNEPITFLENDPVPKWVYEAENPELQGEARFKTNVVVKWNGRVVVEQAEATSPIMYELIEVSQKGQQTNWKGYPTEFKPRLPGTDK